MKPQAPVFSNTAAQELESELAAANKTIEDLISEVGSYENRANALSEAAWRWVFRYRRIKREYLAPVYKALRSFARQTNDYRKVSTQAKGNSAVERSEETLNKLIDLVKKESRYGRPDAAASLAQLIKNRFPRTAETDRLVSFEQAPKENGQFSHTRRAKYHLALAEAHRILGEEETARSNYEAALTFQQDLPEAHSGLASIKMPGFAYLDWLERLYRILKPKTVIEIGVSQSASLSRIPPLTVAIGIDPVPSVIFPLRTEAHIYAETSDEFFQRRNVSELLGGEPLSIGFIDGSHLFEQALRDFMHLEKLCSSDSVIMFHDTVPLDELTQSRIAKTHFSTGDVWKTILCLKQYRTDLKIFTIATPPTGLTLVLGLDPSSRVLDENYEKALAQFINLPFSSVQNELDVYLNMVPNDCNEVQQRLEQRLLI